MIIIAFIAITACPYFVFASVVAAGLYYGNGWVVTAGILFFLLYDPKPELNMLISWDKYVRNAPSADEERTRHAKK